MKEKLSKRLEELKAELKAGQQMEAELEAKLAHLRTTLLRISGAIQVLEEMLNHEAATLEAPLDTSNAAPREAEGHVVGVKD
jgi:predicted  nucleic acid-binding Zn-ribbon protein